MLSIGEFSKICEVSTKTLRYYGEIGLINPDGINPENGYRYYSISQLETMLFINRLKSYDFSLEEIKDVLEREGNRAEGKIHAVLCRKRSALREKARALAYTLNQIDLDISNLENDIPIMSYLSAIEVELVETGSMNILYLRQMLSDEDYAAGYGSYFARLFGKISAQKLTMCGAPMTVYHSAEYSVTGNDTEFAIPVAEAVKGTRDFSGSLCARSVLKGPYPELRSVYAKLREWVENEGFESLNPPYEVYLTGPHQTGISENLVTEVYFPIRKK